MRKTLVWLCLVTMLCAAAPAALAEPLTYTGTSGFSLTLPEDWITIFDDGEDEGDAQGDPTPGEEEALFCTADNVMSLSVYYPDKAQVDPSAAETLLSEANLEARCANQDAYKKMFYRFDAENRRAFLSYSFQAPDMGVATVEYLIGFVTATRQAQYLTISVRQDQHDARFDQIKAIVQSLDIGGETGD